MGVVVSETDHGNGDGNGERDGKFAEEAANDSGRKRRMGMKTATSEALMERTVKPISLAPCMVAAKGFIPPSMWRAIFSMTTIASSTTKPVEMVSAMRERLSRL